MLLISVEVLALAILLLTLLALFLHEKRLKTEKSASGKMTEYWNGGERRQSIRIAKILQTRYTVPKNTSSKMNSFSKNISSGGILLQVNEKLGRSAILVLEILLPDNEKPVNAEGEVVWVTEITTPDEEGRRIFDTGVRFTSMQPKDKDRLEELLRNLK